MLFFMTSIRDKALQVLDIPADFSDHRPVGLDIQFDITSNAEGIPEDPSFKPERLICLKIPRDQKHGPR